MKTRVLTRKQRAKLGYSKPGFTAQKLDQIRADKRAAYASNPEPSRARTRAWIAAHPEQNRANARAGYHRDPEKDKARATQWRKDHPEQWRAIVARSRARALARRAEAQVTLALPEAPQTTAGAPACPP